MKKRTLLCAFVLCAAAMTTNACNDSSGNTTAPKEEQGIQYFLACQSPATCTLSMEEGQSGTVSMLVSSLDRTSLQTAFVSGTSVQGVKSGASISLMDGSSDTASMATNDAGIATFNVTALAVGSSTIQFTTTAVETAPVTFTVDVKAKEVPVVEPPKEYSYGVSLTYDGIKTLASADVMVFAGKTCSSLVSTGMTFTEIAAISGYTAHLMEDVNGDVSSKEFGFKFTEEKDVVNYAVVARAKSGDKYVAYGCTDDMNRNHASVVVALADGQDDTPVVDCEKNPDDPACQHVVDCEKNPDDPACQHEVDCEKNPDDPACQHATPDVIYSGRYQLTSQFDALSLLPSASKNGESVMFKDMLAGDWVKFVLAFLSDPAGTLPDVLAQQLIPLITDAEWFRNLIAKIPTYGPVIINLLDTLEIDDILETFGVKTLIENYLSQLTSQIKWWDAATGGVEIAKELAENFTLAGNFAIANGDLDAEGRIAGNGHNYASILYHNGNFAKCAVGTEYGKAVNNKDLICEIPISQLDGDAGTVKGAFTAQFSEIADGAGTAVIMPHSLDLAYGRLVYAAIIQLVPAIVKLDGSIKLETLSEILAYYVGMGLTSLYNSKHEDKISADAIGCDAVGEVLANLIMEAIKKDGETPDWAQLISTFVSKTTLSRLCTTGLGALDKLIDAQLDKLSVTSDKVVFSSVDPKCNVQYKMTDDKPVRLAYFGMDNYIWGMDSKLDRRCSWSVSIKTSEDAQPKTIKGKFFAYGSK